jgi:hypothetical protein
MIKVSTGKFFDQNPSFNTSGASGLPGNQFRCSKM